MTEVYRIVMEVLKWVEPKTTLKNAAETSALWARVTDSDELWTAHIEAGGLVDLADTRLQSGKTRYREALHDAHIDRYIMGDEKSPMNVFQFTTQSILKSGFSLRGALYLNSAIAVISNEQFFICGGGRKSRANIISMNDGSVTPLPRMIVKRNAHSAVYCHKNVYVFGGTFCNSHWKTAECYRLRERKWSRLPDMLAARYLFNACHRAMKIYLCGGNTRECEVFDIVTYQYSNLTFLLPDCPIPFCESSLSFFYQGQLVTIVESTAYYLEQDGWRPKQLESFVPRAISTAVVYGHILYVPRTGITKNVLFDLDARKWILPLEREDQQPLK